MSHTPGPWKNSSGHITDATGTEIADVEWAGSEPEGKANARLIAAAPDLLLWLKALVHYDDGSSEQGSYGYELLHKCKSVIATAEGRE